MQFTLALVPILALLPSVAAHGCIKKVVIDGTTYTAPLPADAAGATDSPSPIRRIADIGPVKGATNPDILCGLSAQLASSLAPANPGSSMEFYWGNPSGGNWPHQVGALMTYMASCDTSTCDKFNGSTAKWFKIDQIGKKSDGNTWYQQDVANGKPVTLALPAQVAPGDYLVRHEIISLQNGGSPGGAEFYPSCMQIRVGGSQTGMPDQTVSFPGAYSDTDPGILDPNVYNPGSPYVFPGPPVSNLASPSDMSTSNGGQDNGNQPTPATPDNTTTTGSVPTHTTHTTSTTKYGMYSAQPTPSSVEQVQPSVESTTQPGGEPTQPGAYPSQSGVEPTQSGVEPTQSGDQPAPSGVRPTRSGVRSTPSGVEPTQPGAGPTESSLEPTQSGTQYGAQPTPSGDQPTPPGVEPTPSGVRTRSGVRHTRSGGRPTQSGFEPSQSGAGPSPAGDQSTPYGAQPTQPGVEPTQSGVEPTQSGVEPTPSGDQPTQSGVEPTQSGVEPTQSGVEPTPSGGDQPAGTSLPNCGSQRRDASSVRRSNRAQRKRRAHPMRGLRRARHP